MAKRMFDTTVIKENSPGLTYETPKAMPAKFNSLGSAVKLADAGIDMALAYDEKRVTKEAEEIASGSATEYLNQSPSELLFEQQQLRTNLQLNPNNEQSFVWKTELAEITDKLNNAYTQGNMTSYEFERRANAKVMDLINKNPAYRDEIVTETNKTYNALGINDALTADKALLKSQQAAIKDEDDAYNKIILDDGKMNPYDMTIESKKAEVTRLLASEKQQQDLEELSETEAILDLNGKLAFENNVANFSYRNSSGALFTGYDAITEKSFNDISVEMKKHIDNPALSNQEKIYKAKEILRISRTQLNKVGREYTPTNKDSVTSWYNEQILQINMLDDLIKEDINGTALKTYLDNLESNASVVNKLDLRLSGYNPEAVKAGLDMKTTITRLQLINPQYKPTQQELDVINRAVQTIQSAGGAKLSASPNNKELVNFYSQTAPTKLAALGPGLDNIRKNNIEMEGFTKGFINNLFTASESLELQQGTSERIKYDDKLFNSIIQQSSENTNYLIETLPEFRESMLQEVDYYKDRVNDTIVSLSNNKTNIPVNYMEGLGIFNVPNNPKLNNEIHRVNKYIQIQAKIQGVAPNKIAKELLTRDFPMFTLDKVDTQEITTDPTPPTVEANTELEQAKEWLKNNPNAPDAEAVRKKIESMS